jgi:hypothetical protein
MKILLTSMLFFTSLLQVQAADGVDKVKGYLIQKGLDPDLTSERGSPVKVMEAKDGSIKHLVWNATILGIPKPELTQLPTVAEAQALILEYHQTPEEPAIIKPSEEPDIIKPSEEPDIIKPSEEPDIIKPSELKLAEAAVIQYLRTESVISNNATTVTQAQLAAWIASWEGMTPTKAQTTQSTYLRLMLPVLIYGGDFATVELNPN